MRIQTNIDIVVRSKNISKCFGKEFVMFSHDNIHGLLNKFSKRSSVNAIKIDENKTSDPFIPFIIKFDLRIARIITMAVESYHVLLNRSQAAAKKMTDIRSKLFNRRENAVRAVYL